jgi:hypothetical protein
MMMGTTNRKLSTMCGEYNPNRGVLLYEDASRRIKTTNKERVGFEIEGGIPVWESIRKNRLALRYDTRSIINFANYTRKKEKRAEGIVKFKHKYTVAQQLIFWKVLLKLAAAKLVENRSNIILPHIGKLRLTKTDKKGTYYDVKEGKFKVHLNLHTLRKFVSIQFAKMSTLDASSVVYKKSNFIRLGIYLHYKKKVLLYEEALQKLKEKYYVH